MNKERRKELRTIISRLQVVNLVDENEVGAIKHDLESILYDEENYMDNIPENLQGGYRYEKAEEACDNLQSALDSLEDEEIIVDDIVTYIYNAMM